MLLAAAMPDRVSPERTVELAPLPGLLPVSPPSPGSEGLSGMVEPPSSMLPSTRPRTASEASPAVTRPSPLRSRPLFHWYSMLPLDHRVELGSDFGEPYSTEVYNPSSVDRLPLPEQARSMKYCSTYCSCSTELICAKIGRKSTRLNSSH